MNTNINDFHDCYRILTPRSIYFLNCPCLSEHAAKTREVKKWNFIEHTCTIACVNYGLQDALRLIHATSGKVTMKMLGVYRDRNEHHYNDVCDTLGFPHGHDIDCWRSLVDRGLIAFSSKHAYGKRYYKITPFGEEVLGIVDANQVYYRVARWYKIKGEDVFTAMMKADLNGEESWKDLLPESINALLEALFNHQSRIHQIGSAYRWMNNFMYLVKSNNEFLEKVNAPETRSWLDEHKDKYASIRIFLKKLDQINKKAGIA